MKTLGEVIKAKELCRLLGDDGEECNKCPYAEKDEYNDWSFMCGDCEADVLFYLKEYRDYRNADKTVIENDSVSETENKPLTMGELKKMIGKPVWLMYDWNKVHYKGWILLDHMEGIFIVDAKDCWALSDTNMDKWQAFRKERR